MPNATSQLPEFHPATPLFVLLEKTDVNNPSDLIYFAKQNLRFQDDIQENLLKHHINRLRIKDGKEAKNELEIGADDAVPFRVGLILDYLSRLDKKTAESICEKINKIEEKLYVLLKVKIDGIEPWGKEQGLVISLNGAFDTARDYQFIFPEDAPELKAVQDTLADKTLLKNIKPFDLEKRSLNEMLKSKHSINYIQLLNQEISEDNHRKTEIVESLLNPGPHHDTLLGELFKNNCTESIRFAMTLIDPKDHRFANIVCDEIPNDSAYLDLANKEFLMHWLSQGFDINHRGQQSGNTVLHKRYQQGDSSNVVTLMKLGANPRIKNNAGHTPRQSTSGHKISFWAMANYSVNVGISAISSGLTKIGNLFSRDANAIDPTTIEHVDKPIPSLEIEPEPKLEKSKETEKKVNFSINASHTEKESNELNRKGAATSLSSHAPIVHASLAQKKQRRNAKNLKMSEQQLATWECVQALEKGLADLKEGKHPDFCHSNSSLPMIQKNIDALIYKLTMDLSQDQLNSHQIKSLSLEMETEYVLQPENPLTKLSEKLKNIEDASKAHAPSRYKNSN